MQKVQLFQFQIIKIGLIIIFFLNLSGCADFRPKLFSLSDQNVISDNTPVLSWQNADRDWQEIWIDGVKMDSLGGNVTSYVPFPLSYGEHKWKVVTVKENNRTESDYGYFTISGEPLNDLPEHSMLLRNDWSVLSSYLTDVDGAEISSGKVNTKDWHKTSIPATTLSVLVRNGMYPNPYIGMNNMLIPDLNDEYNQEYNLIKYSHIPGKNPWKKPYWFVKQFETSNQTANKKTWLHFDELNYKAEVWLNGTLLGDTSTVKGMERSFRFDISDLLRQDHKNIIAVAVYPVDYPGKPATEPLEPFGDPGANMGDGIISKNYTKWDALGWDWQPAIRDREMGITEDVFLSFTDELELKDLYVTSDLNISDSVNADITLSVDLKNYSEKPKSGIISGFLVHGQDSICFQHPFDIPSGEQKSLTFDPSMTPQLHVKNPRLWWPAGYGEPNLYKVVLTAKSSASDISTIQTDHGIRKVESYTGDISRVFKINGKQIYLRGGNWVMDMMLNWTSDRYEKEILLTKNANLNILRVWGPTGVPPEAFYKAADKHGILVWQDFLNDFWGTFKNTPGYQPELPLYKDITTSIVKQYRNHPSLIMWCGGNEGVNPREDEILNILSEYDNRDSRIYLKQSDGDGLHGGGPYHTIRPEDYFLHKKLTGFSSEIGPSGLPVIESINRFMPRIGKDWMEGKFPIDTTWAYHDAVNFPGTDTRKFTTYDNIVRQDYGPPQVQSPQGIENYFSKAQMINYDVYRAAIESVNKQMWSKSTGILLWKSNSSWPSMVWQIYDWYLQSHAGYYGTKKASEPVHVQFNRDDRSISVINNLYEKYDDVKMSAVVYDSAFNEIWTGEKSITINANSATGPVIDIPVFENLYFLKLTASTAKGELLSDNFYWLHEKNDFTGLSRIPEPDLSATVSSFNNGEGSGFNVTLTNTGEAPAIMTRLKVVHEESGHEILPALWEDNFFSLLPGEHKNVSVLFTEVALLEQVKVTFQSFNMSKEKVAEINE